MKDIKQFDFITIDGVEYADWDDVEIIPESDDTTYTRRYVNYEERERETTKTTVKIMTGIEALLTEYKGEKHGYLFVRDTCVDIDYGTSFDEMVEGFRDLVTTVGTKELFAAADYMSERGCGLDYAVGCGNPDNFDYIWDGFQYRKESLHKVRFVD